jgi:general stress protein 26
MLDEVLSWFGEQQVVYLATAEGPQPRVRPMTLIKTGEGFYMITGARGGVQARKLVQIRGNPRVEYYLTLEGESGNGFIRGEGVAAEVEDKETKARVYDLIGWAKNFFDTVDHPDYVLLKLEHTGFSYRKPGEYDIHGVPVE